MKKRSHPKYWPVFSLLVIVAMLLASCATPQATEPTKQPTAVVTQEVKPTTPPTQAPEPTKEPTKAEAAPTEAAPTEAPTEATAPTEPATTTLPIRSENFSPDIPDPTEPVVIKFATWTHQEGDAWGQMADKFHEIHPNITIEFQDVPFEEMRDKLLTQVAAGNPPDAAYVDAGVVSDFGSREALVQLDDYIAKSKSVVLEDYIPAFLTSAKVDGKLFGLPIDGETTGLFYRKDRFEAAGLDPNKPPATWEEFMQYAEKLTDPANKKYAYIVFAPEAAYYFYPWLWQAGGGTINPDNPNDVIWDSEAGQKAANFYVNLAKYSPPDYLNSNSWDGRVAFVNGDVAMYMAGAWFAGTLMSENPEINDLWATAPLPKDQRCATTVASDHLVVFQASKNPAAAYKWLEFVSAPENMALLNLGTPENPATLLPPRQSILDNPEIYVNRPFMKGFAENMACAVVETYVQPRYYDVEQILNDFLGRAFYGEFADGATAVKEAATEAETFLANP